MTETRVKELLDALAETAPEPSDDLLDGVYWSAGVRRRPVRRLMPVLVAVATILAVLAAVGVVTLSGRSQRPADPATPTPSPGDAALAAGTRFAQLFFSTDYRAVDAYADQVMAGSTGVFRSDFAAKRGQLRDLYVTTRTVTSGRVLAAAVRDVTPTTATVLVAADQSARNSTTRGRTATNRYRVLEQLRLIDGRWLVEDLEPDLGGSGGCPDPTTTPERDALLRQACAAVETVYSFDYRRLDADLAAATSVTVGPLREAIEHDTAPGLRSIAPTSQATVKADVSNAAIETLDGDTARVLLFLNQTVSNTQLHQPRFDRNRLEATLQRVDGRWLVADIKAL